MPGQVSSSVDPNDLEKMRQTFSRIYERNDWGFQSGVGAQPANNREYTSFVRQFMDKNGVRSVVDFGRGDWHFSRFIDWPGIQYLGVDVVQSVIERNRCYTCDRIAFQRFESVDALPSADLLICKDVFQHLPNDLVKKYLPVFKSNFRFMLITNDDLPAECVNNDIEVGDWRTIRLDQEPFFEHAAVVLSWVVLWGRGWTRKATYLPYGGGSV